MLNAIASLCKYISSLQSYCFFLIYTNWCSVRYGKHILSYPFPRLGDAVAAGYVCGGVSVIFFQSYMSYRGGAFFVSCWYNAYLFVTFRKIYFCMMEYVSRWLLACWWYMAVFCVVEHIFVSKTKERKKVILHRNKIPLCLYPNQFSNHSVNS